MNRAGSIAAFLLLSSALPALAPARAQSFGAAKEKVTLTRKLPALVHLTGDTIKVKVAGGPQLGEMPGDFQALLETELMKDDPSLRVDDSASTIITCQIIDFSHPPPTVTIRPELTFGKDFGKTQKNQAYTRITGSLSVSFQARNAGGRAADLRQRRSKYDEEFDSSGNSTSHGVMGSFSESWARLRGGESSEELNPPTDAELRSRLMLDAVDQIAEHIVNTNQSVEVYLAKQKGALDEGDKAAQAGLWERALETFETAPPFPRPSEDAYRLYNIGVAYEALAYQAEDDKGGDEVP